MKSSEKCREYHRKRYEKSVLKLKELILIYEGGKIRGGGNMASCIRRSCDVEKKKDIIRQSINSRSKSPPLLLLDECSEEQAEAISIFMYEYYIEYNKKNRV
jgi:hypothetical protein